MKIYKALSKTHSSKITGSGLPKEQIVTRVLFKLFSKPQPNEIPKAHCYGDYPVKIEYFPELYELIEKWCSDFTVSEEDLLYYALELYLDDSILEINRFRLSWPPQLKKITRNGILSGLIYMD